MIAIHVDVDNLWVYENEYGCSFGKDGGFIFDHTLPFVLDFFDRHNIHATFFIVGKDLEYESARSFFRAALKRGHSLANHTYSHCANFALLSFNEKRIEIKRCHDAIFEATGYVPVGFRAPGYYIDHEIISILIELGYKYDASVLPSYANSAMKVYMALLGKKQKVFGRKRYPFLSTQPTIIRGAGKDFLYELPISVVPFLRSPAHPTFIYPFGRVYFNLMKILFKKFARSHTYLFHAIDFVDVPRTKGLSYGVLSLSWSFEDRMKLMSDVVSLLKEMTPHIDTIESQLHQLEKLNIPQSFFLSHGLHPYGVNR